MPYVDKEKRKEYQKRTATPYMRLYREKNRERDRIYRREYQKKRRANKEVAKRDYQVAKKRESYKRGAAITNEYLKLKCAGMDDRYIVYSMTKRGVISKEVVNKELIEIHKKMIMIKRKLKTIKQ